MLYLVVEVVHVLSILTSRGHLSRGSVIIGQGQQKGSGRRKKRPSMHQREAPKVLFSLVFTLSLHSPLLLLLLLCCPPSSLLYCLMIFPSCSLSLGCAQLFHTIAVAALPTHSILFLAIDSR